MPAVVKHFSIIVLLWVAIFLLDSQNTAKFRPKRCFNSDLDYPWNTLLQSDSELFSSLIVGFFQMTQMFFFVT